VQVAFEHQAEARRKQDIAVLGVPTVNGQTTTLSQCGIGLSQRAKAFAMEFPFDVKAVFPIGVDVRVACRRQMHHIDVIDVIAFGSQLWKQDHFFVAVTNNPSGTRSGCLVIVKSVEIKPPMSFSSESKVAPPIGF